MEIEVFEREIEMCKKLNRKNSGSCNWGECKKCGVIPLLYKIYKKEFLEVKEKIDKIKTKIFNE